MPLADKWGDGDGSWGELVADLHSLDAEMAQLRADNARLRAALSELFNAYCNQMRDGYDFPGRPWTPERDNDEVAMRVRDLLAEVAP